MSHLQHKSERSELNAAGLASNQKQNGGKFWKKTWTNPPPIFKTIPLDLSGNRYYEVKCQAKDVKALSRHDSLTFIDTDTDSRLL